MKKLGISLLVLVVLAGCGSTAKDDKTIRVGASTTPHAEIIEHVRPVLEEQGYKLEITQFTDYVKPNTGVVEGSLDANFFQHQPYLDGWAKDAKAEDKITSIFTVHFEPLGIYSVHHKSLDEVADGDKIAIPNDATNGGRALKLLQDKGILTLKDGVGIEATKNDITGYKKKVEIIEMNAETCASSIQDLDYSVVNGNNALNAKITKNVLAIEEDEELTKAYGNVIAVQPAHKDDAKIKALIDALNTKDVKNFINEKYNGVVVPLVPVK